MSGYKEEIITKVVNSFMSGDFIDAQMEIPELYARNDTRWICVPINRVDVIPSRFSIPLFGGGELTGELTTEIYNEYRVPYQDYGVHSYERIPDKNKSRILPRTPWDIVLGRFRAGENHSFKIKNILHPDPEFCEPGKIYVLCNEFGHLPYCMTKGNWEDGFQTHVRKISISYLPQWLKESHAVKKAIKTEFWKGA